MSSDELDARCLELALTRDVGDFLGLIGEVLGRGLEKGFPHE